MNSHPPHRRPGVFGRPVLTVAIVLAVLAAVGVGSVAFANRDRGSSASSWQQPSSSPASSPSAPREESAPVANTVTLSATGDIMMSNAPNRMPPADGDGFFDSVKESLASDLVMGNLEQPLTENTGASKCGAGSSNCFAFRSPPSYVKHLSDGGFDLVNTANNHAKDFGTQGARNTRAVLDEAGILATGNTDEITVTEVNGVKVAVVGFSSYAGANSLIDLDQARSVIEKAKEQADLVVVQVHMGAEGSGMQHVKPGTETFHGENRGDPIKFSHAVIDAGADLVVGHGPHVLRGMEFYNGKLIAYSLGNFAGGGRTLSRSGVLKYGGILHVTLGQDGSYAGGKLLSTYMNSNGLPTRDASDEQGRKLVADLSAADFPDTGVKIGSDGSITPSA
ncbi:CapA family protein [Actinoplanes bogorensis]|uniref:CapA family protein n=1 Tax=Paractinoplanes bogorensis TaxID=1610840 RepID=A0ABS5YIW7_9ACTN|nr:CapA family protein [Actinoplanes bogorensis]MBU2663307.1 CapA family protein [Actinoplanes bogorensis]